MSKPTYKPELPIRLKYVQADGGMFGKPVYSSYEAVWADGEVSPMRNSLEEWAKHFGISIEEARELTKETLKERLQDNPFQPDDYGRKLCQPIDYKGRQWMLVVENAQTEYVFYGSNEAAARQRFNEKSGAWACLLFCTADTVQLQSEKDVKDLTELALKAYEDINKINNGHPYVKAGDVAQIVQWLSRAGQLHINDNLDTYMKVGRAYETGKAHGKGAQPEPVEGLEEALGKYFIYADGIPRLRSQCSAEEGAIACKALYEAARRHHEMCKNT